MTNSAATTATAAAGAASTTAAAPASRPIIIVTGASGNVGVATLNALRALPGVDARFDVRAGVRDTTRAADKLAPAGFPLVAVDPAGPLDALALAFRGASAVFIVTPAAENRSELAVRQIDAAKAAGVGFVLLVSVYAAGLPQTGGAGTLGTALFARQFRPIEEHAAAAGVPHATLRLPFFLDNFFQHVGSVKSAAKLYSSVAADAKQNSVAVADVARVAAAILTQPAPHAGKVYTLTARAPFTLAEQAATLGRLVGKPLEVVVVPHSAAEQAMLGAGWPAWQVKGIVEMNEGTNAGELAAVTDDVERVTGKPALTSDEFLATVAAAFQ